MFPLFFIFHQIEKRIGTYVRDRLRAPPLNDILKWAVKLGVPKSEAILISDRIPLRHQLGEVTSI